MLPVDSATKAVYIVQFDPLDGSSNINAERQHRHHFLYHERPPQPANRPATEGHVCWCSARLENRSRRVTCFGVAAATVLAYTAGNGVHMVTLDPAIGAFVLVQENVQMLASGKTYSVNSGNRRTFPSGIRRNIWTGWNPTTRTVTVRATSVRWWADFHRTLMRGGVFLCPQTRRISPDGKLRWLL